MAIELTDLLTGAKTLTEITQDTLFLMQTRRPPGSAGPPKVTRSLPTANFTFAGKEIKTGYLYEIGDKRMFHLFVEKSTSPVGHLIAIFGQPATKDEAAGTYNWTFSQYVLQVTTYPSAPADPIRIKLYTPSILTETWAGL